MLVYGGNTHNETAISNVCNITRFLRLLPTYILRFAPLQGAKCYSSDFIAYDTVCDSWYKLQQPSPTSVGGDLSRYGHLAASFGPSSGTFESKQDFHEGTLLNYSFSRDSLRFSG